MLRTVTTLIVIIALAANAEARRRVFRAQCTSRTQCTTSTQTSTVARGGLQAEAQWEAAQMASRGVKGHVRGTIAGVRFSGVGWSSSSSNAPTCRPGPGMQLVADAVARGRDGWYRVRYWR